MAKKLHFDCMTQKRMNRGFGKCLNVLSTKVFKWFISWFISDATKSVGFFVGDEVVLMTISIFNNTKIWRQKMDSTPRNVFILAISSNGNFKMTESLCWWHFYSIVDSDKRIVMFKIGHQHKLSPTNVTNIDTPSNSCRL